MLIALNDAQYAFTPPVQPGFSLPIQPGACPRGTSANVCARPDGKWVLVVQSLFERPSTWIAIGGGLSLAILGSVIGRATKRCK